VNLVIGTLYCTKQNFEFGISRIIKSLDLYAKKIEMDTWFYAKRCFLALVDNLAKQMIVVQTAFSPKNQHFSLSILWAILTDDTMAKHFEAFQFNLIFFFTF
jgi:tetratricopeptide repeat protein 30